MRKLKYIKGFGFELEGGWEEDRFKKFENMGIMKGDGSVETDDTVAGEIASKVFGDIYEAWDYMKTYYPDEVNRTCGFHIHISVDDGHYAQLMERDFYDKFIAWAKNIGEKFPKRVPGTFMARVEGKNTYCQAMHIPTEQVKGRGDRYTQINYCHSSHKTMENRMFPGCKNPKTAFFLLVNYLLFIEDYLEHNKIVQKKHEIEVVYEMEIKEKGKKGELICA